MYEKIPQITVQKNNGDEIDMTEEWPTTEKITYSQYREKEVSVEGERKLAEQYKAGDDAAGEKLIENYMGYITFKADDLARKLNKDLNTDLQEDLIQEGRLAILEAAKSYDPESQKFFSQDANKTVAKNMMSFLKQNQTFDIHLSQLSDLMQLNKEDITGEYNEELHKKKYELPNSEKVPMNYDHPPLSIELVRFLMQPASVETIKGEEYSEDKIADISVDNHSISNTRDKNFDAVELKMILDIALNKLNEEERNIITLFYGMGDSRKLSIEEISEEERMGPGKVKIIVKQALAKMLGAVSGLNMITKT